MSRWGEYPSFFDWGDAQEVEGGLVARRGARQRAAERESTHAVGHALLETLSARVNDGVVQRGRSYARKGQTVALAIEPGEIHGSVQGALDEPYAVRLNCTFPPAATAALIETLARVLPRPDVEIPSFATPPVVAELAALDLMRDATVTAHCTCPYGAVCKHCIAVAILAAERLDESPKTLATFLGVAETTFAARAGARAPVTAASSAPTYETGRLARLAKRLSRLDADPPPDRDTVIAAAIGVLPAPDSVRRLLGLRDAD